MYNQYKLLETFLWSGSVLLPLTNEENLNRVAAQINEYHDHPIYAIAKEVMFLGETALSDYKATSTLFNNYYKVSAKEIYLFFQGYNAALYVLTKLYSSDLTEITKPAIINSNSQQSNVATWTINGYVLQVIQQFREKHNPKLNENYPNEAIKIFDYCETTPLNNNKFFLLGIIASKTVFREFTTQINLHSKLPPA